jgi:asparagine synthetase B (glutamine-hydrolysing)
MGWFSKDELKGLIKVKFNDPFTRAQEYLDNKFKGEGAEADLLFNKLRFMTGYGLVQAPHMLERADGMTMAHPVEVRLPFLDQDLVEFVYSLPSGFFVNKNETKRLLRSVATDLRVPAGIIVRPKQRTSLPYLKLFYNDERYSHKLQKIVTDPRARLKEYLDSALVDEIVRKSESNPRRLLGLIILEIYFELTSLCLEPSKKSIL